MQSSWQSLDCSPSNSFNQLLSVTVWLCSNLFPMLKNTQHQFVTPEAVRSASRSSLSNSFIRENSSTISWMLPSPVAKAARSARVHSGTWMRLVHHATPCYTSQAGAHWVWHLRCCLSCNKTWCNILYLHHFVLDGEIDNAGRDLTQQNYAKFIAPTFDYSGNHVCVCAQQLQMDECCHE